MHLYSYTSVHMRETEGRETERAERQRDRDTERQRWGGEREHSQTYPPVI